MKLSVKKLTLTGFLFCFFALLPMSCGIFCNDSCGCDPVYEVRDFSISSFETKSLRADGQRVSPETVLPYDEIYKAFLIKEVQVLSANEGDQSISSTFGLAMACSPMPPKSIEKMTGVQLINTKEITLGDGTILELGQDLTELFGISYFFSAETVPISQFFDGPLDVYQEDLFKLEWLKDPEREVVLEFTLRIFFENGKEFTLENEIMSIS